MHGNEKEAMAKRRQQTWHRGQTMQSCTGTQWRIIYVCRSSYCYHSRTNNKRPLCTARFRRNSSVIGFVHGFPPPRRSTFCLLIHDSPNPNVVWRLSCVRYYSHSVSSWYIFYCVRSNSSSKPSSLQSLVTSGLEVQRGGEKPLRWVCGSGHKVQLEQQQ